MKELASGPLRPCNRLKCASSRKLSLILEPALLSRVLVSRVELIHSSPGGSMPRMAAFAVDLRWRNPTASKTRKRPNCSFTIHLLLPSLSARVSAFTWMLDTEVAKTAGPEQYLANLSDAGATIKQSRAALMAWAERHEPVFAPLRQWHGRRKEARQTTAQLRRAWPAARPSYVPASWQVKDEKASALRERREREDAMHETARIEHCCRVRQ